VATTRIARSGHVSKTSIEGGRALYLERYADVEYQGRGTWIVPSGSHAERVYEVRLGRVESCECEGGAIVGTVATS
jgi:hypothetical protein